MLVLFIFARRNSHTACCLFCFLLHVVVRSSGPEVVHKWDKQIDVITNKEKLTRSDIMSSSWDEKSINFGQTARVCRSHSFGSGRKIPITSVPLARAVRRNGQLVTTKGHNFVILAISNLKYFCFSSILSIVFQPG